MIKWISKLLDSMSNILASRKGLLPLLGILLIIINLGVIIIFPNTFISNTNLFLHLGAIISVFGLLLAKAL